MPAEQKAAMPDTQPTEPDEPVSEFLTLEEIDSAPDRQELVLVIPEWHGKKVKIQGLSYDAISHARAQSWDVRKRETNEDLLNAWCLTLGLLEPTIKVDTAKKWIMQRSFGPVNMILTEILAASGLGKRAADAAKSTPES